MKVAMTRHYTLRFVIPRAAVAITRFALLALAAYGMTHMDRSLAVVVAVIALAAFVALHFYARALRFDAMWAADAIKQRSRTTTR